ncbi:MAG: hypothetical protein R3F53_23185 [Gammaproteobacteria bacterium]
MDATDIYSRNHSLKLFELKTDNEPIKFVNQSGLNFIKQNGYMAYGYFTLAKWLYGADPIEIEERLGLRKGEFGGVAYALVFNRLPRFEEFTYKLTAAYPNGKHRPREMDFAEIQADKKDKNWTYNRSMTPVGSYYPRGDGSIHQWYLLKPLRVDTYVRTITPTLRFARRDGTMNSNEPNLGRLRGVHWT